ncbi:bile acid:sodium symporter family protein [Paenalcaligenes sp. Me131]|uniref:bile acid:sodium symporter family protein n=1 Tax=Paenalcaligenes sp. Me131 TaxID=3392636 RepID=UPI003D27F597
MLARLRLLFDNFTLILIAVVALATFLPAHGQGAVFFDWLTNAAIALLFFMHGAKLSREAIIAGATHWRLHLVVFSCTFVLFPLIGWAAQPVLVPFLGLQLAAGILYLCVLPGTVQSAIAFTSIAKGNVPAAICSSSASSIIAIVLTPLLLKLLLETDVEIDMTDTVVKISLQILLPFVVGHLMRPLIGHWVTRNQRWLKNIDQGSILLVVYTAFSASVVGGLWAEIHPLSLLALTFVCLLLLFVILYATRWIAKRLHFDLPDEITIVFCASKKSLATGVPMAQVLFAGSIIGPMLLPLLIFHQVQLMACAVMANQYALKHQQQTAATA